ncbi:unnamed protein product [Caenorhabditis auriculariae]|uniref:Uncharacterized protein n=1 Tax=Caenorhabditis auriculariae TaxID=2777116 RepID=A0A8S1HUV5_9PELO|nr:unnamed protein product [Caenorhabditis auriculariae]
MRTLRSGSPRPIPPFISSKRSLLSPSESPRRGKSVGVLEKVGARSSGKFGLYKMEEACVMFLDQLTQDCLGKNCIQNVSSFLKFLVESTEKMVQIDREHSNTWNNYHGWHVNWRQCLYVLNETERGVETAFYDWIAAFSQRWNMIGEHKKEINDVRASLKRFLDDYKQRPREEELNSFIVSNDFSSGYDKENEINDGGSLGEPKTFEKSDSTEKSGDAGKLSESASVHEKFDEENYAANNKTSSDNVSEASSWEEIFCCCGDSDGTEHFSDHGGEVLEKFDNLEKMNEDVTKKKGLKFQSDLLKQTPCDSEKVLQNLETTAGEAENIEKPQDPIVFDPMSALQKNDYLNLGKRRFDQLIYQKQKASLKEIKDNMTNLMEFVKKMETDFSAENVENAPNNLSDDSMWLSLESSFQHLKKRARNGFSMQEMKRNFP